MKIAIFAEYYFPYISGVVTHIETLRQVLEAHGHEVLIVTLDPKCTEHYVKGGVLYCPAIPLKRIYGYGIANPLNLKRLRVVKAFDPDILHIHTEFTMGLFGQFAARKLKKPVVYTLHTMYDDYLFYVAKHKAGQKMMKPAAHLYIRKMANKATEVIGPSLKVVEYLRRCGVERHVNVIPNIVDTSAFLAKNVSRQQVDKVRAELGIRAGDTALCFVGRLGGEKSLDVLISWFCESFRGDGRFKLFIIGEGPEPSEAGRTCAAVSCGRTGASAWGYRTLCPAPLLSCMRCFCNGLSFRNEFHLHAGGNGQRAVCAAAAGFV